MKVMKVRMLMAAMLFSGVSWAQTNDLERLNRIVDEQSKEIELLKAQLARIESVLAINASSTSTIRQASLVTMVQQVPQPAPTAQQIQEQQRAIVTQALAGKWYERFALRGYTQIRYSNVFSGTGPELEVPADRSVNENESLMIRRGRFVLAGDAASHLALYAQMDFNASTGAPDFSVQMRDLYADVSLDSSKQFRFRLGLSKVPFGWSNMQSSQNRGPLERPDGINSAAEGERDLGAYFMWASSEAKQRFRDVGPLKGTGDYGVVALGVYSGQGPNRADQNGMVHTVARATYPFKFANGQFFELGVQGYHGRFVTPTQAITDRGTSITPTLPSRGVTDQRAGLSAVWYPQPLGIEVEWNVGQGPELSADLRRIESNFLHGGYAQMNFRRVRQGSPSWFPFARWNYFDGGRKFARNAPKSKVNELDLGFEFSPWPEVEITPVFTRTLQRTRTGSFPYDTTRNANRLGVQLQLNY